MPTSYSYFKTTQNLTIRDWAYRIPLTVDSTKIDSNLTHFPIPIVLTGTDAEAVITELGSNNKKIKVENAAGTQLYCEIEQWDTVNNKICIWVSRSTWILSSTEDETIYFYYDSTKADNTTYVGEPGSTVAQNIWDSNFVAVYHMSQDPSGGTGAILDSTVNEINGTPGGSMASEDLVDGEFGKAIDFNGSTNYIQFPYNASYNADDLVVELFSYIDSGVSSSAVIWHHGRFSVSNNQGIYIQLRTDGGVGGSYYNSGWYGYSFVDPTPLILKDEFTYITLKFDRSDDVSFYVNGVETDNSPYSLTSTLPTSNQNMHLACAWSNSQENYAKIKVSEFRISNTVRSAAWIKATNATLTLDLLTIGTLEDAFVSSVSYWKTRPSNAWESSIFIPSGGFPIFSFSELYGNRPVSTTILNLNYGIKLGVDLDEQFGLKLANEFNEDYAITHVIPPQKVEEIYSIKLFLNIMEYYNNKPVLRKIFNEYYDNAIVPLKTLVFNYDSAAIPTLLMNELYADIPKAITNIWEFYNDNSRLIKLFEEKYQDAYQSKSIITLKYNSIAIPTLLMSEFYADIPMASTNIWESYNDIPIVRTMLEEKYQDAYQSRTIITLNYNSATIPTLLMNELYADIPMASTNIWEFYNDIPIALKLLEEKYQDAYQSRAIITLKYNSISIPTLLMNELYADIPMAITTIWESYNDTPRLIKLLEEKYQDAYVSKSIIISSYNDSAIPTLLMNELYADISMAITNIWESYNDIPIALKLLEEKYQDAYQSKSVITLKYSESIQAKSSYIETYDTTFKNTLIIDEKYSITGTQIVQTYPQIYNLDALSTVNTFFKERYYTIPDSPPISTVNASITIDGVEIDFISISISISIDTFAILGSIELATEEDYLLCNYMSDVICSIEGTDFVFFLENKAKKTNHASGTSYEIQVVSPTVKLDAPYSKSIIESFPDGIYAEDLVNQMATLQGITVDYQILDWFIPNYAISINNETPLSVIKKVVNAAGAILQTKPDGTLLVISKYETSPEDWDDYEVTEIISSVDELTFFSEILQINDQYNAFVITDQGASTLNITLKELDIDNNTKIIKGFRIPFDDGPFELKTSGGPLVTIEKYMYPVEEKVPMVDLDGTETEEWEYIEFIDWVGKTSYPIYEVIEAYWEKDYLGAFRFSEEGTLTVIDQDVYPSESLLKIKYKTKYWQWLVTGVEGTHVQFYVPEEVD